MRDLAHLRKQIRQLQANLSEQGGKALFAPEWFVEWVYEFCAEMLRLAGLPPELPDSSYRSQRTWLRYLLYRSCRQFTQVQGRRWSAEEFQMCVIAAREAVSKKAGSQEKPCAI